MSSSVHWLETGPPEQECQEVVGPFKKILSRSQGLHLLEWGNVVITVVSLYHRSELVLKPRMVLVLFSSQELICLYLCQEGRDGSPIQLVSLSVVTLYRFLF